MCIASNPINNIIISSHGFCFAWLDEKIKIREKEVMLSCVYKLILNLYSLTSPEIQETHGILYSKS